MSMPDTGPLSLADLYAQVAVLHELAARAGDHGQDDFSLLFHLTADSLESNAETMGLLDV